MSKSEKIEVLEEKIEALEKKLKKANEKITNVAQKSITSFNQHANFMLDLNNKNTNRSFREFILIAAVLFLLYKEFF